ncbi:MAG: TonB-dependent receptor [Cellvibrio sp. 79]|nr:MAG: TonB-dependent receptor [Cellvibrio sp. 79]
MFTSKNKMAEMSGKGFKRSLLAVSIMALSVPSFAQNAGDSGETLDEVVVTGMKVSIQSAQELKRSADTVKDVITASDIGALPDKSVTEALQRVPGVTIERFASSNDPKHYADEGTGVLVRGLDRVRSEVNGRDAFSANPGGGLSYEDFPAELLGAVEIVKNQTSDLISGGIAGTVNLITRKPFDSDERLIAFSAKANYGDYREEVTPSFSALFSDSWETSAGKFGFLLAGSQSEYESRGDGIGLGNFHSRGDKFVGTYDQWGTVIDRGHVAGKQPGDVNADPTAWNYYDGVNYDGPCTPKAWTWSGCTGPTAKVINSATEASSAVDGPAVAGQPAGSVWYVPAAIHMSTAENDRERTGFTTSLQWANNDETVVATVEHINSEASLEWRERQIGQAAQGFKGYMGLSQSWSDVTVDSNGHLLSGVAKGNHAETPMMYRSRWNYNENTVEDTSVNLVLKPTDRLSLELDYQHIDSEKVVHNYSMAGRTMGQYLGAISPYRVDLTGSRPTIEYMSNNIQTAAWYKPNDWTAAVPNLFLASGMEQEEHNTAKSDSVKFDLNYEFDGIFTAIKSGLYYSDKELIARDTAYEGWAPIGVPWEEAARNAASAVTRPQLFERVDFSDYYGGKVLQGEVNNFLFPKMDLVKNYADSLRQGCKEGWHNPATAVVTGDTCTSAYVPYEDMTNRVEGPFAAHNIGESNEKRAEFYVRGDFDFADLPVPIKGNLGLRYVNYQLEATSALVPPLESVRGLPDSSLAMVMQRDHKAVYDLASGKPVISTIDGTDYDTILPSLNLTFGVAEDVVVRFGLSQGLFYPGLTEVGRATNMTLEFDRQLLNPGSPQSDKVGDSSYNPVVALNNVHLTANKGNPYLEPEESVNVDLTAEWYFAQAGSLSVGLFNKELDNIIRNKASEFTFVSDGNTHKVAAYGPENTGSGTIRGIEFSYSQFYDMLPGAWSGLGLQFNYTYIDQNGLEDPNAMAPGSFGFGGTDGAAIADNRNTFRVFTGLPLQGYSDENLNIVGMYEYKDVSFRLAYTWRSEYLLTLRESEEFVPAFAEASGMVDASLYYTINDSWKVGIEGSNLLNTETKTQYQLNQAGDRTDALSFTTDRRYALSVRATF